MVQTSEVNASVHPTEDLVTEKESLLKKFDIPIHHLDFSYVQTCANAKELEQIYQILKSGQEGHYPDLLKRTEERLFEVKPNSKYLRTAIPVLTKYDVNKEEWNSLSSEIQNWVEDIAKSDKELQAFKDLTPKRTELPIRESGTPSKKCAKKQGGRIRSMDYDSWDKLDVDAEILKMDLEEEKLKRESLDKMEKKEKLNSIVFNPDVMTQAELTHAATEEKLRGNECFKSKDYEDALQHYSNSIAFLPTAASYNNRAITYIKLSKYKNAVNDCDQVLKLEPRNEKAFLRKAEALKSLKQYDKVIECLGKLIQIDPHNQDAQNMMNGMRKHGNLKPVRTVRLPIIDEKQEHKETRDQEKQDQEKQKDFKEVVEKRSDVLIPIPSTSNSRGPFCKVVNVPEKVAKILTNTKKTPAKSDKNVINLNKPEPTRKKAKTCATNNRLQAEEPIKKRVVEPADKYKTGNERNMSRNIDNNKLDCVTKDTDLQKSEIKEEIKEYTLQPANKFKTNNEQNISKSKDDNKKPGSVKEDKKMDKPDKKENRSSINNIIVERTTPANDIDREDFESAKNIPSSGEPHFDFDIKILSPYEFLRYWQLVKKDGTLVGIENLLRSISPSQLVAVLGNKLDGEMFSIFIQCLANRFNNSDDAEFVATFLTELAKIPRFDILVMLMNNQDKVAAHNILNLIKSQGLPISQDIWYKYSVLE